MLSQIPQMDAADRKVPPGMGKTNAFFVTLSTLPIISTDAQGQKKTKVKLNLNLVMGPDGKPQRVSDKVFADFAEIQGRLQAVAQSQSPVVENDDGGIPAT